MSRLNRVTDAVRRFHSNEEGNETLQSVMLMAVAALILVAVKTLAQQLKNKAGQTSNQVVTSAIN